MVPGGAGARLAESAPQAVAPKIATAQESQHGQVDLRVDAGGIGVAVSEVVADLLEAQPRLQQMSGTGVTQAMWPPAFGWSFVYGEVALDYGVQSARRQWREGCAYPQEHDPAGGLGSCLAQVARDRIADLGHKGGIDVPGALGSDKADPVLLPVDVVETQPTNFTGTHPVDRQQQDDRVVSDRCRVGTTGRREHAYDSWPCRTHWQ